MAKFLKPSNQSWLLWGGGGLLAILVMYMVGQESQPWQDRTQGQISPRPQPQVSPSGLVPQPTTEALRLPSGVKVPTSLSGTKLPDPTLSQPPNVAVRFPTVRNVVPNPVTSIPSTNVSASNSFRGPSFNSAASKSKLMQPSLSSKTSGDGPGALLPNLPDPLDTPAHRSLPKSKPAPSLLPKVPASAAVPEVPSETTGVPPVSAYSPASDQLKLSPSQFSEPPLLQPESPSPSGDAMTGPVPTSEVPEPAPADEPKPESELKP